MDRHVLTIAPDRPHFPASVIGRIEHQNETTYINEHQPTDNRAGPPALPRFGYRHFTVGGGVNLPTLVIANLKLEIADCRIPDEPFDHREIARRTNHPMVR